MGVLFRVLPVLLLLASASAQAKLVIYVYQDGSDIAVTGSLSANMTETLAYL